MGSRPCRSLCVLKTQTLVDDLDVNTMAAGVFEPSRAASQTSASRFLSVRRVKEAEWKKRKSKKISPPPTAATWRGRRAVGREPAGRSRAYLWSVFSSLQSEAPAPRRDRPRMTGTQRRRALLPLHYGCHPVLHPGCLGGGGVTGTEKKDVATSAEWFTAARHAPTRVGCRACTHKR